MDTASFQFVLFGLAAAVLSNCSRSPAWRSFVLFASTIAFLGLLQHDPRAFIPFFGFLVLGYAALLLVQRRTVPLALALFIVVFTYAWLKKYTFLPPAIFLHSPYFTLGLSYVIFRTLHLIIESAEPGPKPPIEIGRAHV